MTDLTPPDPGQPDPLSADPLLADTDPRWRVTPTKAVAGLILLVGIIVPLLVSTYDKINPRLFGFPFFYWYQLLWVFLAAGLCGTAFLLLKRENDRYRADHQPEREVPR